MTTIEFGLIIAIAAVLAEIVILFREMKLLYREIDRLDNFDAHLTNAINNLSKDISSNADKIRTLEENGVKPVEFELTEDEKRDQEKYQEGLNSILNFSSQKKPQKEDHAE